MNQIRYIGCCGAYCKTCKPFIDGFCKGCKLGFDSGERDVEKAKCKIKICCFKEMKYDTCADCSNLDNCKTIGDWYAKNGYKYKKYKQAIEFIKKNGYPDFIKFASKWNGAYGKLN
jgi:adenosine deaminase